MNKRIMKIDPDQKYSHNDEPKCRVSFTGEDADGDRISVEINGEDAREYLRLAQALAGNESRSTEQLIRSLDERRTLEAK